MRSTPYYLLLLIVSNFLILGTSSCRKQKAKTVQVVEIQRDTVVVVEPVAQEVKPDVKPIVDSVEAEINSINIDDIDFKYFNCSSKFRYQTPKDGQNATVNFRIKKDSIIWFSISGFGIEAVRGIVKQDSIFAIDKLHREYYKFDFASLSQKFNVDLNYGILQSLVMGNIPLKKRGKNKYVKRENDYYIVHQEEGKVLIDNYIGKDNRKLKKLLLTKPDDTQNKMTMTFGDFQQINNFVFPYESLIKVDYLSKEMKMDETIIEIKHKKVEFQDTPLTFPFSIPTNYSPKN